MAGFFVLSTSVACTGRERAISVDQLPVQAQSFISKYFQNEKVLFAKKDTELFEKKYEVVFGNRTKIEFRGNGEWSEVDCQFSALPEGILDEQIIRKADELYPGVIIVKAERDRRNYEVKLLNRMELSVDNRFNLVDLDD